MVAMSCVVIALLTTCPNLVSAFDCTGHILTALVAFQHAAAVNASYVNSTIQPLFDAMATRFTTLSLPEEMACFPDDMKSWTSQYSDWHYYDQCYTPDNYPCPKVVAGQLPAALEAAQRNLANTQLSDVDRGFWLAFLIHLVGDAHQPLHLCTQFSKTFPDGDLGGNNFMVFYNGDWIQLHVLQDDGVDDLVSGYLSRPILKYPAEVQQLRDGATMLRNTYDFPASVANDLNFSTWLAEAYELCSTVTYQNGQLVNGSTVDATYINAVRMMIHRQVALGGARLAVMLGNSLKPVSGGQSDDSRSRAVAFAVVGAIGAIVLITLVAGCVKTHCGRRRRDRALLLDMPYEGVDRKYS